MPYPFWPDLALFMALTLTIFTYVMAASGHFPREVRGAGMAGTTGRLILWASILLIAASSVMALAFAYQVIPWYYAVIGGGFMVLIAPFVLQPFPDNFVDGPAVLILLTLLAAGLATVMWRSLA